MTTFRVPASGMNEQQRRIAEFVSRNADRMPYLTVGEVARELDVSIASVSRFARLVGFSGFKELKSSFRGRREATPRRKVEERLSSLSSTDVVGQLVLAEIAHLQETAAALTPEIFDAALRILTAGRRLFVYAGGPNEALAQIIEFRFGRFGYDVRRIGRDNARVSEQVAQMRENDAVLTFGFFRESSEVTVVLRAAERRGLGTILVTDLHVSRMSELASVVILVDRGRHDEYHSLVAPLAVIDCLVLGVAQRLPEESADSLDRVARARAEVEELRAGL